MLNFEACAATQGNVRLLADCMPYNPFATVGYMMAQQSLGTDPWVLMLREGDLATNGCLLFLKAGRISRSLAIPSIPSAAKESGFWDGFNRFLKEQRITDLECQTFGSSQVFIPPIPGEIERVQREEFHLDLRVADLWTGLSTTHRRWIKKGAKQSLELRRSGEQSALHVDIPHADTQYASMLRAHMLLCDSSLERRRLRGEAVFADDAMYGEFAALLRNGVAELHQALLPASSESVEGDREVASSILVLRSSLGAYLMSAGTSELGRSIGASHFLVYETALALSREGVQLFNLGGVRSEETGLRAYKAAFGATAIPLISLIAAPGSSWRRSVTDGVRRVAGLLRRGT